MNDNLSQMVKDTTPPEVNMFSESDLDIPAEEEIQAEAAAEEATVDTVEEVPAANVISIAPLSSWFEAHCDEISNINQVKVSIRGVDGDKTLIMAVKDDETQESDGNEKRTLRVFDNADTLPVLNLDPLAMNVYNNGFRITYQISEEMFVKTYGVRTGLICTFCNVINGKLIPYVVVRTKKKDTELEMIPSNELSTITAKLQQDADLESLQLLYKQAAKATDDLTTNQSVIDWLLERQDSVTDINHHLQIDNVIINILS